jgi:ricin-type beta-trefoil lectin protein
VCLRGSQTDVWSEPCSEGNPNQIWELTHYSGNRYTIRNNDTRLCLTANWAGDAYSSTCGGYGDNQLWSRA